MALGAPPRVGPVPPDAEAIIREARRRQRRRRRRSAVIALVAGAVAVAALLAGPYRSGRHPLANARAVGGRFINARAFHGYGDLAFVSLRQLFVLDGKTRRLVAASAPDDIASSPGYSPDGRWLTFMSTKGGARLARADGTGARPVPAADWLPNGDLVGGGRAYRVSWSGTLSDAGAVPADLVAWSANGDGYAFVSRRVVGGAGGSFRGVERLQVAATLTGPRTTWREAAISFDPATGFHGDVFTRVVVLAHRAGVLYSVDPDGSASASADGLMLYELRAPAGTPAPLGVTGSPVTPGPAGRFAIVAGGDRYAWVAKTVKVCDAGTAACSAVPLPKAALTFSPAWSPDGRTLAFVAAASQAAGQFPQATVEAWYATHVLWSIATGKQAPSQLGGTSGAAAPMWSRDGRAMLYVAGDALWLIAPLGSQPVKIAGPLFPSSSWPSFYGQVDWDREFSWSSR